MKEQLDTIREEARARIAAAQSAADLAQARVEFLGKKGKLRQLLRSLSQLSAEERPVAGALANETRAFVEGLLEESRSVVAAREKELRLKAERQDVTLPGRTRPLGRKHPLSLVLEEVCGIFTSLAFEIVEGPEVELDYYNFVALNIPADHPARDDHASFYFNDEVLLRTETSAVQIRTMEDRKPPVRVISPGRVHRRDAVDRTHSHTFHQVEGFLVDTDVTFGDLKGTLAAFARRFFGETVSMRFRPHYFPFTEPSAEVDISCTTCGGSGCGVCSNTGWIEVLGSGMIHPKVLENVGYDPDQLSGFAFGMGVERLAMLKYGIDDMRLFFENDLRFLRQFS